MKIVSYLLNKLNGFKIGINEEGNAQLISYRNHPFTNTGGGAKRVEAFVEPGDNDNEVSIAQSKYDELNVGDVLVGTLLSPKVGTMESMESIVACNAPDGTKLVLIGGGSYDLVPSIPYPVTCLLSKDGEIVNVTEVTKGNNNYLAGFSSYPENQFTATYDLLFGLDATLVKLERCNGSFEPTGVVSGATLDVKTVELSGNSITCTCLSFSDDINPVATNTYNYKATLTDGEINFLISYQVMA